MVRASWASTQPQPPCGKWVYENLRYKRIAMIGYDFAFGWEVAAGFQRTFEEAGGQVVQKLWSPLNTADYAPYITGLRRDVDAIYCIFSGADALRFAKQFADSALKGKVPLVCGGTFTDEHLLRSMGDEVLGVVTALHHSAALPTPAHPRVVPAHQAKHHQVASHSSDRPYVARLLPHAA